MDALRKPGRIAGLWFVGTFVFSIPAVLLYDPVLNDTDYVFGAGSESQVAVGAVLEVFLVIANIATAVVFFPVLKHVKESVALGYVASRITESAIIVTGLMSLLTVTTLRDDLGTGSRSSSIDLAARAMVDLHDWTFTLGPQLCAGFGNGILLGYLMYRSGLVPPRMALLGLVGGPLAFLGGLLVILGALDNPSAALFAFTAVEILWEASLALYLTIRGYRESPLLEAGSATH
jgi:hypothetical protein